MPSAARRPAARQERRAAAAAPAAAPEQALLAVYTTVGSLEQARVLARELVQRQLAACAQICPIESFYHWRGALQNEAEFRVLLKTTAEHYASLEAAIRRLHPYELPAIYAVTAVHGFVPYARWVADSCGPPTEAGRRAGRTRRPTARAGKGPRRGRQ